MNACVYWERLEKKHNIVIDGNKATVSLGNKPLFRVKAILGTKAAELTLQCCGTSDLELDVEHVEALTDANLASELNRVCLFILAQRELAEEDGCGAWT